MFQLYGPTWNSGVPIFAANLCSKPLEPVKSELPTPSSPQKNIELQEPTVPEFDWNGSGLTNLQDCEYYRSYLYPKSGSRIILLKFM